MWYDSYPRITSCPAPQTPIILGEQQRADLRSLACSRTLLHRLVQRAQIRARLRGRGAGHRHRRAVATEQEHGDEMAQTLRAVRDRKTAR